MGPAEALRPFRALVRQPGETQVAFTMPNALATLRTARLVLRPFNLDDAPAVQRLLGDRAVAEQTLTVPHPYPPGAAVEFIGQHAEWIALGKRLIWAITLNDELVGAMGLHIVAAHRRAEVGYWIARARWGQGIATEALRAVLAHGFDVVGLHRIDAQHYKENPASGAVMRKVGMTHEGRLRGVVLRDGVPRDNELYAMLRTDPRP
jgi:RimJ/RimL family protein N-acetyltransferase